MTTCYQCGVECAGEQHYGLCLDCWVETGGLPQPLNTNSNTEMPLKAILWCAVIAAIPGVAVILMLKGCA